MGKNDGTAEKWVIEFIKQLRTLLPQGQYIITSARKREICFLASLNCSNQQRSGAKPLLPGSLPVNRVEDGSKFIRKSVIRSTGTIFNSTTVSIPAHAVNCCADIISAEKTEYTSCDTLLNKDSKYPKSSVFEIHASGVPLDKIVIGKPAVVTLDADPNEGVVDPKTLASCLSQAKGKGWSRCLVSIARACAYCWTHRCGSHGLAIPRC